MGQGWKIFCYTRASPAAGAARGPGAAAPASWAADVVEKMKGEKGVDDGLACSEFRFVSTPRTGGRRRGQRVTAKQFLIKHLQILDGPARSKGFHFFMQCWHLRISPGLCFSVFSLLFPWEPLNWTVVPFACFSILDGD
jgi:hypothetical protein